MNIRSAIILSIASVSVFAFQSSCKNVYYENNAPDILNLKMTQKTKELCFSNDFAVVHSGITRTPLFAGEMLTKDKLSHKTERTNDFHPDSRLPENERSELNDFARSGYDRGHMVPSADQNTIEAQHDSFTLSNIIPQDPSHNRGIWASIESATRHLAKQRGKIYVITGPIFTGSNLKRIGGRVLVPTQIYKAIYDPASGQAAAYLTNNAPGNAYKVISIAELEQITQIKFFQNMSESAKRTPMTLPEPQIRNEYHADNGTYTDNIDSERAISGIKEIYKAIKKERF